MLAHSQAGLHKEGLDSGAAIFACCAEEHIMSDQQQMSASPDVYTLLKTKIKIRIITLFYFIFNF